MNSDDPLSSSLNRLQAGLRVLNELEDRIEDETNPRLELARSRMANASQHIGSARFEKEFTKAMGVIGSVAVTNGYDNLANDALEIGGDGDGS